jgi:peptide-methionine (S)-S-oxide reductase
MSMARRRVDFRFLRNRVWLILVPLMLAVGLVGRASPSAAEIAHAVPLPLVDETAAGASTEVAVLAGGCFWGVQGVFQHVGGVIAAVSGYAGGARDTAHYQMVGSATTGHAEAVRITFDPHRISYGRILQIYFSVAHDPTELNRQGPDTGTQYRSTIFPQTPAQVRIAHISRNSIRRRYFPRPLSRQSNRRRSFTLRRLITRTTWRYTRPSPISP